MTQSRNSPYVTELKSHNHAEDKTARLSSQFWATQLQSRPPQTVYLPFGAGIFF
jgi:hypothetical protein